MCAHLLLQLQQNQVTACPGEHLGNDYHSRAIGAKDLGGWVTTQIEIQSAFLHAWSSVEHTATKPAQGRAYTCHRVEEDGQAFTSVWVKKTTNSHDTRPGKKFQFPWQSRLITLQPLPQSQLIPGTSCVGFLPCFRTSFLHQFGLSSFMQGIPGNDH